ncbi:MAG: response regulator transcription factor [Candidatus Thermoplasmatota archaeon]|nr:response regulator transcription factor [Candidatus Thermoplasmatota archaeon]
MKGKILVVDDEEDIRNLARIILEDAGYEIIAACDAKEAFEKASAEMPDVILLDIIMPERSGLEACREMKAQQKTHSIPIVMFSVLGKASDKEKARKMGADGYLVKPFTAEDLLAEVKKQMKRGKGAPAP